MSYDSVAEAWNSTMVYGLKDLGVTFGEVLIARDFRQSIQEARDPVN